MPLQESEEGDRAAEVVWAVVVAERRQRRRGIMR